MTDDKVILERIAVSTAKQRYMHLVNKGRLISGAERVEKDTLKEMLQARYIKEGEQ